MIVTKTQTLTGVRRQKVIVEYHSENGRRPGWWVMFDDGRVEVFEDSDAAYKAIMRAAGRRNVNVTMTTIEWRDTPISWEAPK